MTTYPAPRVIGRYVLCDLIASGGMATVHLGRYMGVEGFSRTVAIKQLHAQFSGNEEFVAMLLDEARLLARIRHSNVLAPLDVVVADEKLFIVVEYVHAEPLSRLLRSAGEPTPPPIACAIMSQVLSGLHAAHRAKGEDGESLSIVHRDVSPQNILVAEEGTAKIVDFGIAKAALRAQSTHDGQLKGKRSYMAPEQLRGHAVDHRTDIYSSAVVLWEMLTGKRLFAADDPALIEEQVLAGKVQAPSRIASGVPTGLDTIVLRALSLDPDERFGDARSMATALAAATPPASSLEVAAWVERHVGGALRTRAALIADLESARLDEITPPLPASRTAAARSSPEEMTFETVREPVGRKGTRRRPAQRAWAASVAVLALAAALAVALLDRPESAASDDHPHSVTATRVTDELAAPAHAQPISNEEPRQVSPAADPTPETRSASPPVGSAPASTSRAEPRTARPAAVTKARPSTKAAARPATSSDDPDPRPAASSSNEPQPPSEPDACNPPYVIDERGFKRFILRCVKATETR